MNTIKQRSLLLLAFASIVLLAGATSALAQVSDGQQVKKLKGVVTKRNPDSFVMLPVSGGSAETTVLLTESTSVKTQRKGLFGGGTNYGVGYILKGLRVDVDGVGNANGQIVASAVRFTDQDLRTAQAIQQTDQLAQENEARIAAAEANAAILAARIEENTALAQQAQAKAEAAQARADAAMKNAERANNRINGLDDYDHIRTFSLLFRPGSSVLTAKAKADIAEGAKWVRTQNTNGWVVAVVGFADTTGNTARNRALSDRRAKAVIDYLVTKYNLPLHRLVQPFGYGDSNPVADNKTADGRAKNRRVEIRLLANKGITEGGGQ